MSSIGYVELSPHEMGCICRLINTQVNSCSQQYTNLIKNLLWTAEQELNPEQRAILRSNYQKVLECAPGGLGEAYDLERAKADAVFSSSLRLGDLGAHDVLIEKGQPFT